MLEPLTHLEEYGDEIVIYVDLPFVKKEDICIYLRKNVLDICATARSSSQKIDRNVGFLERTREYRSFRKILKLPYEIEEETAKAKFHNGILRIVLKKKIKSREIQVV